MKTNMEKFTTALVRSDMDMTPVSPPLSQIQSNCWCFASFFFFNSVNLPFIENINIIKEDKHVCHK